MASQQSMDDINVRVSGTLTIGIKETKPVNIVTIDNCWRRKNYFQDFIGVLEFYDFNVSFEKIKKLQDAHPHHPPARCLKSTSRDFQTTCSKNGIQILRSDFLLLFFCHLFVWSRDKLTDDWHFVTNTKWMMTNLRWSNNWELSAWQNKLLKSHSGGIGSEIGNWWRVKNIRETALFGCAVNHIWLTTNITMKRHFSVENDNGAPSCELKDSHKVLRWVWNWNWKR